MHALFARPDCFDASPQHLTSSFFLDRSLNCISLVYKGVDPQVHNGQPKTIFFSKTPSQTLAKSHSGPDMAAEHFLLAMLIGNSLAAPFETRDTDPVASAIAAANVPQYVAPTTINRDITDWLAIGDSFSAGISADVPADELQSGCRRFKQSYPNQMNNDPRLPGHSTSRTFVFGSCSGATMQQVVDNQIELGTPDLSATYPKIGVPQIGTLSLGGNDLGFGEASIVLGQRLNKY